MQRYAINIRKALPHVRMGFDNVTAVDENVSKTFDFVSNSVYWFESWANVVIFAFVSARNFYKFVMCLTSQ